MSNPVGPAVELGYYSMPPWNDWSLQGIDPTAKWIWNSTNAQNGAPPGAVTFQRVFAVPTWTPGTLRWSDINKYWISFASASDLTTLYINNTEIVAAGGTTDNLVRWPVTITQQYNTIKFVCNHAGSGPAGLFYSVKQANSQAPDDPNQSYLLSPAIRSDSGTTTS